MFWSFHKIKLFLCGKFLDEDGDVWEKEKKVKEEDQVYWLSAMSLRAVYISRLSHSVTMEMVSANLVEYVTAIPCCIQFSLISEPSIESYYVDEFIIGTYFMQYGHGSLMVSAMRVNI